MNCIATMEGSHVQRGCGTGLAAPKVQEARASQGEDHEWMCAMGEDLAPLTLLKIAS